MKLDGNGDTPPNEGLRKTRQPSIARKRPRARELAAEDAPFGGDSK